MIINHIQLAHKCVPIYVVPDLASGNSIDWVYDKLNVPLTYTFEFRDQGNARTFKLEYLKFIRCVSNLNHIIWFDRLSWIPSPRWSNHTKFIRSHRWISCHGQGSWKTQIHVTKHWRKWRLCLFHYCYKYVKLSKSSDCVRQPFELM